MVYKENTAIETEEILSQSTIGDIIKRLMQECGNISEAELARQTKLPQATINRLLLNYTINPRAETIISIAKFFHVTVGELLGTEPLDQCRITGSYKPTLNSCCSIPIIKWEMANSWNTIRNTITPNNHTDWIVVDIGYPENTFAIRSPISLEPLFPKNSVLIFSPCGELIDRSFILVKIKNSGIALKCINIGDKVYLEALHDNIPLMVLDKTCEILGFLRESRLSF
jgi:transcriptional regulator with XRE-family HTH domain